VDFLLSQAPLAEFRRKFASKLIGAGSVFTVGVQSTTTAAHNPDRNQLKLGSNQSIRALLQLGKNNSESSSRIGILKPHHRELRYL
jgi:hypothetical protein